MRNFGTSIGPPLLFTNPDKGPDKMPKRPQPAVSVPTLTSSTNENDCRMTCFPSSRPYHAASLMPHAPLRAAILPLLAALLLAFGTATTAQAQRARLYTLEQGLGSSYINHLFIDRENFVWVATEELLSRFDGYRFSTVTQADPQTGKHPFTQMNAFWQQDDTRYWLGTNMGLYIFQARERRLTHVDLRGEESGMGCSVIHLIEEPDGQHLIVGTNQQGNYVVDLQKEQLDSARTNHLRRLLGNATFEAMMLDSHQRLWVNDTEKRLRYADLHTGRVTSPTCTPQAAEALANSRVTAFLEDTSTGRIYLGVSNYGIFVCDPAKGGTVRPIAGNRNDLFIFSLLLTSDGRLLVGTDNRGIWQMDRTSEQLSPLSVEGIGELDPSTLKVHALREDRDGNVLAGLYQRGLLVLPRRPMRMDYLPFNINNNGKNSSCVTSFATTADGTLWTGTDGSGVFATSPDGATRAVSQGLRSMLVQTLATDEEGHLWCGSWSGGVQMLSSDGTWQTPTYLAAQSQAGAMALLNDPKAHCLYAAINGSGVLRIRPTSGEAERLFADQIVYPDVMRLDPQGQLWVADVDYCYRTNPANGQLQRIEWADGRPLTKAQDFAPVGSDMVIATPNGLYVCDRKSGKLREEKFAETTRGIHIIALMPDDSLLWMTSSQGLLCLNVRTAHLLRFQSFGGYYLGEFHKRAFLAAKDGWMAIGGDNGAMRFLPLDLLSRQGKPGRIFFTGFRSGDFHVTYDASKGKDQQLDADILFASRARLRQGDNSFDVTFSVPQLGDPRRIYYRYRLEGYETTWHDAPAGDPHAYYASLPSGNYTLHVKAFFENADASTNFSEATLSIHVPAPWYASPWAIALYVLLAAAITFVVWRSLWMRHQARLHLRASIHKEQIKEAQLKLFTSIAHELRSPLTLIVSPLSKLIHSDPDPQRQQSYSTMQRNANRLLRIVGQITDVRKIDNGQFQLHFQQVDLDSYLADIMASFDDAATARDIEFTRQTEGPAPDLWIDPIHFEKVIVNLLSNAFKFTPSGGRVTVRVETVTDGQGGGQMLLTVYNSGSSLSDTDLAHLFERFYQSRAAGRVAGSGIGLNLASELVRLHHGTIEARNAETDGVEFRVSLPLGSAHLSAAEKQPADEGDTAAEGQPQTVAHVAEPIVKDVADDAALRAAAEERLVSTPESDGKDDDNDDEAAPDLAPASPRRRAEVLLVDDDLQLLDYMRQSLEADYDIHTACSGNQAWQWMLTHRPDAVITDVMMPDGDGYELCRRIKGKADTSHIAIIVLTSQGTDENRLTASELQVEHFLPKPFDMRLLQASLRQVLSVRDALIGKMRRTEVGHDYESVTVESADENLLKRVHECVMNHMDDPEFSVEQLAQEVGISRVHLNRRLRQLYNVSPGAYIRSIRLKQAAYLLANNKVNVSEVAWKVGFSSLSYFSANFRKHFGMSPKEFVAAYEEGGENDEALQKLLQ